MELVPDYAPSDCYEAAAWLRGRHEWLDHLLSRVVSPLADDIEDHGQWLDPLVEGFTDLYTAEGDLQTLVAENLGLLSSGERDLLMLLTTLAPASGRAGAGWVLDDLSRFDARGRAIFADWVKVTHAQFR